MTSAVDNRGEESPRPAEGRRNAVLVLGLFMVLLAAPCELFIYAHATMVPAGLVGMDWVTAVLRNMFLRSDAAPYHITCISMIVVGAVSVVRYGLGSTIGKRWTTLVVVVSMTWLLLMSYAFFWPGGADEESLPARGVASDGHEGKPMSRDKSSRKACEGGDSRR